VLRQRAEDVRHRCDARFKTLVIPVARGERPGLRHALRYYPPSFLNSIRRMGALRLRPDRAFEPPLARLSRELRASRTRDTGSLRGGARRQISPRRAVAIYCFDEAGIGLGDQRMRFINEGKPVLASTQRGQ